MPFKKTKYATNFWLNNYLSNVDLLYKYKLKTLYKLPKLEKVVLSLNLNKILSSDGSKKYLNSVQAQRLLFFYLFSLFTMVPFIKVNSLTVAQKNLKGNESDYSLVLSFLTQKQIQAFLFIYFIEAWSNITKNGYKFYFKKPFFLNKKKNIELKSKLPLASLSNFNIFFNPITNQLIKEDSTFFATFKFKDLISTNSEKCIKNLPFFWKNL